MTISRERIAAYADGELNDSAAREIEQAIAADPDLRAQLEAHQALKARLSAHFAPLAGQPVPERLVASLKATDSSGDVIDFAAAARSRGAPLSWRKQWSRVAGPALAASVVLVLVGLGLTRHGPDGYAGSELASALDKQLVETQPADAPIRILLSFRDREGHFCRGFAAPSQSGIACQEGGGWRLRKVIGGTAGEQGQYRQADNPNADILATIQDMAEGPALDAQAERRALGANWSD